MNREEWRRLDHWLRMLPSELIDREPRLLLLKACLRDNQYQYAECWNLMERAEPLVAATDLKVNNYHALVVYNWGEEDRGPRPFIFGGLGATNYSPGEVMDRNIESNTRFSSTWGGGVKLYAGDVFGFKVMGRWTPTYIKTDASGIWCSPYWPWGCYVVGETDYANQLELTAGVTVRF